MSEEGKPMEGTAEWFGFRMEELMRNEVTTAIRAKEEGRKVASWAMMNCHDEVVRAMDIAPAAFEVFGGSSSVACQADKYLQRAEAENFSRSLCTYATCTLGFDIWRHELGGDMPPDATWGGMGKPDMMIGSAQQICDPRFSYYQAAQHYYRDVPLYVGGFYYPQWDPLVDDKELREQERMYVKYNTAELHELVRFLEKHTGRKMDWDKLAAHVELADRTWDLYVDNCELRKTVPTPMDTGLAMYTQQPLGFLLGTQEAYDYYMLMNKYLKQRISEKKGVAEPEKYRLIWAGGLPSWFALGDFFYFNKKGAAFAVEVTYRNCERIERLELPKTNDPLEHMAWRLVRFYTIWYDKARKRPGSLPTVERIIDYIEDYGCDGVVFHSAFSCRSWHAGLMHQAEVLRKVYRDIPILIMEGDIVDPSSYNEADTHNRIDAFIETIEAAKGKR
jgi:benzoyl-CoA reductase/2-hydroxyglutaryl-CoA dehydratase subunit BcrC/BadD/HgdB